MTTSNTIWHYSMTTITQKRKIWWLRTYIFLLLLLLFLQKISKVYPEIARHQFRVADLFELWDRDGSFAVSNNSYNTLPFCQENLLDRRSFYHLNKSAKRLLVEPKAQCKLFVYTSEHVLTCLEILKDNTDAFSAQKKKKMLHFAFIGDSRIRQQFFNFLKLIPEYDRRVYPNPITPFHHGFINVNSSLLNLRITFHWHALADEEAIQTIRQWTTSNEPPHFVLLGMASHHMLSSDNGTISSLQLYQQKLLELIPSLARLANVSRVVWLNQYPTVDFYGDMYEHNTDIHAEKIHDYNQAVRRIFQNHNGIRLWDSSNSLAEEYVRSCALYSNRKSGTRGICGDFLCEDNQRIHETLYRNCKDYIHTGYVALSQATQILLNDICNKNIPF